MGVSKETCVFSNLPILSGEEARAFVLTKRASNRIHGESAWSPYIFPVKVIVDDYGAVKKVIDEKLALILKERISTGIKKGALKISERLIRLQGEEKTLEENSVIDTPEEVFNLLGSDTLLENMVVVYAREDVYQKMLEIGQTQKAYLSHFSDIPSHAKGIVNQVPVSEIPPALKGINRSIQGIWGSEYEVDPAVFNSKLWRKEDVIWVKEILYNMMYLRSAMIALRKEFVDVVIGSQQTHWLEHQKFAECILRISQNKGKLKEED